MKSMLFEFVLVLALVATIDGAVAPLQTGAAVCEDQSMPNQPPANVKLACPEPFLNLGDSCYYFNQDREMDWDLSQTFCGYLASGGRLVEFETEEELTLVTSYMDQSDDVSDIKNYRIGAIELGNTSLFVWNSTGNPVLYSNWGFNQPDNDDTAEDTVFLEQHYAFDDWEWFDTTKLYDNTYPICETLPITV